MTEVRWQRRHGGKRLERRTARDRGNTREQAQIFLPHRETDVLLDSEAAHVASQVDRAEAVICQQRRREAHRAGRRARNVRYTQRRQGQGERAAGGESEASQGRIEHRDEGGAAAGAGTARHRDLASGAPGHFAG